MEQHGHLNKPSAYKESIDRIIQDLSANPTPTEQELHRYQVKLDKLASLYQYDESLGTARYKLYHAQAILFFRISDFKSAQRWIKEAIKIRGASYTSAEQLLERIKQKPSASTGRPSREKARRIENYIFVACIVLVTATGDQYGHTTIVFVTDLLNIDTDAGISFITNVWAATYLITGLYIWYFIISRVGGWILRKFKKKDS